MAKSREEMQDIALYHMDKMNRRTQGQRENKPKSLQEEWNEMERWNKLTPEQRNQETPWGEYLRNLKDWMNSRDGGRRHGIFTDRFYSWLTSARKKELMEYHAKGTQFKDMAAWIKDMSEIHINI
jgi:hypothetical protein